MANNDKPDFVHTKPPEKTPGTRSLANISMEHIKAPVHKYPDVQFALNIGVNIRGLLDGTLPSWLPIYRWKNESDAALAKRSGDTVARLILTALNKRFPAKPASNRKRAERTGRRFHRMATEQLEKKIPFTPREINPKIAQEFKDFIKIVD